MYFIKKNWGLLLSTVVFLAIVVFLTMRIFSSLKRFNEAVAKRTGSESWFNQVNSDGWKILSSADNRLENAERARANKEVAVGHFEQINQELLDKFSFNPQLPNTSSEAQDWLADKIDLMTDYAIGQNRISWHEDKVGGRFCELAEQAQPIMKEDFPAIFRQLTIYDKLVRHISNAGVKVVNDLYFPRWLATEDAGEYTVTPIVMNVQADAETLQKLVNNMVTDPTMLIFIRNMKFYAVAEDNPEEEYTQITLERSDARSQRTQARLGGKGTGDSMVGTGTSRSSSRRSSRGQDMGMGMDPGNSRRSARSSKAGNETNGIDTGRGTRGNRTSRKNSGDMGMGIGMGGTGMSSVNEADLVYEEPKRRDFLVLRTPRQIELELTLDLMEYAKPEAEQEEAEIEE